MHHVLGVVHQPTAQFLPNQRSDLIYTRYSSLYPLLPTYHLHYSHQGLCQMKPPTSSPRLAAAPACGASAAPTVVESLFVSLCSLHAVDEVDNIADVCVADRYHDL